MIEVQRHAAQCAVHKIGKHTKQASLCCYTVAVQVAYKIGLNVEIDTYVSDIYVGIVP